MKKNRRNHSPAFKAKVALEAAKKERSLAEPSREYGLHVNQIGAWKRQLLDSAVGSFESGVDKSKNQEEVVKELHAKIGELTVEGVFVAKARSLTPAERKAMINKNDVLPVKRRCELLDVPCSSAYYQPVLLSEETPGRSMRFT